MGAKQDFVTRKCRCRQTPWAECHAGREAESELGSVVPSVKSHHPAGKTPGMEHLLQRICSAVSAGVCRGAGAPRAAGVVMVRGLNIKAQSVENLHEPLMCK